MHISYAVYFVMKWSLMTMKTTLMSALMLSLGMTASVWAAPATTANVSVDSPYYGYIEN